MLTTAYSKGTFSSPCQESVQEVNLNTDLDLESRWRLLPTDLEIYPQTPAASGYNRVAAGAILYSQSGCHRYRSRFRRFNDAQQTTEATPAPVASLALLMSGIPLNPKAHFHTILQLNLIWSPETTATYSTQTTATLLDKRLQCSDKPFFRCCSPSPYNNHLVSPSWLKG